MVNKYSVYIFVLCSRVCTNEKCLVFWVTVEGAGIISVTLIIPANWEYGNVSNIFVVFETR